MLGKFFAEIIMISKGFGSPFAVEYLLRSLLLFHRILKTKSLGPVDQSISRDRILKVRFKGNEYLITGDMLPTSREIFLKDCYKFNEKINYRNVIDLGANRGNFTIIASKYADLVVSVECDTTEMPRIFNQTMELNNANNVRFENLFVSSKNADKHISVNSLLSKHCIRQVDLIKIDIEGAETDLFSSNTEWLNVTNLITMEVHPCFNVSVPDITRKLIKYGFHVVVTDLSLSLTTAEELRGMGYLFAMKQ